MLYFNETPTSIHEQLKFDDAPKSVQEQLKDFNELYPPKDPLKVNDQVAAKLKLFFKALEAENTKTKFYGSFIMKVNDIASRVDVNQSDSAHIYEVMKIASSSRSSFTKSFTVKLMNLFRKNLEHLNYSCHKGVLSPAECKKILEIKLNDIGKPKILGGGLAELKAAIESVEVASESVFILKPDPTHAHVLPLILRKDTKILEILCLDSRGNEKGTSSWVSLVTDDLSSLSSETNFYYLDICRQTDRDNCSVFTISDIKTYFKLKSKGIDLFKHAQEKSILVESKGKNLKIFAFTDIPPRWMKLTQSSLKISDYLNLSPAYSTELINKRSQNLQENIDFYSIEKSAKSINKHADFRFAKYCCLIADKILNLSAPLKEIGS